MVNNGLDKRGVSQNASVPQFFGGPPVNTTENDKTIKVTPQHVTAPRAPSTAPMMNFGAAPAWFGTESGSDPFASIGQSEPSVSELTTVPLTHTKSFGAPPPIQTFPNVEVAFAPQQPVTNTGVSISKQTEAYQALTAVSYEGTSFIGDETFEQLSSVSGSSAIHEGMAGLNFNENLNCPRCQRSNDSSSTFCARCGFQLQQQPLPTAVPLVRAGTLDSMVSGRFSQAPSSFSIQQSIFPSIEPSSWAMSPSNTPMFNNPGSNITGPIGQNVSQVIDVNNSQGLSPKNTSQMVPRGSLPNMTMGISRSNVASVPLVSHAFPPPTLKQHPLGMLPFQRQQAEMSFSNVAPVMAEPPKVTPPSLRVYPIFCFGFGGQIFSSFPMKQMRFAVSSMGSQTSSSAHYRPGPMYRMNLADLPGVRENLVQPILSCLNGLPIMDKFVKIKELLEFVHEEWIVPGSTPSRDQREVLFKLIQLMLSHKGGLAAAGEDSLRKILLNETGSTRNDVLSPVATGSTVATPPGVTLELTRLMSKGDRVNAVSLAVSHQLWPHALLIASHVDRETYCATVSEYARHSIPISHPLRAMYLLFAGQPSLVGAELQQTGVGLKGTWTWNLAMILSNRTAEDFVAITGLGDALLQIGEVFAAHVCFLLSDNANLINGYDSAEGRITYIGCDHQRKGATFYRDWISLRRTEALEYALRQASGGQFCIAHLQAYKLLYAQLLADLGLASLALRHCEAINETLRTFSGTSPYLHPHFKTQLKAFHDRIAHHLGRTVTLSPEAGPETGWLPKMGGLLEAFDRGLTRVIGVSTDTTGGGVPVPYVKEDGEILNKERRLSIKAETETVIESSAPQAWQNSDLTKEAFVNKDQVPLSPEMYQTSSQPHSQVYQQPQTQSVVSSHTQSHSMSQPISRAPSQTEPTQTPKTVNFQGTPPSMLYSLPTQQQVWFPQSQQVPPDQLEHNRISEQALPPTQVPQSYQASSAIEYNLSAEYSPQPILSSQQMNPAQQQEQLKSERIGHENFMIPPIENQQDQFSAGPVTFYGPGQLPVGDGTEKEKYSFSASRYSTQGFSGPSPASNWFGNPQQQQQQQQQLPTIPVQSPPQVIAAESVPIVQLTNQNPLPSLARSEPSQSVDVGYSGTVPPPSVPGHVDIASSPQNSIPPPGPFIVIGGRAPLTPPLATSASPGTARINTFQPPVQATSQEQQSSPPVFLVPQPGKSISTQLPSSPNNPPILPQTPTKLPSVSPVNEDDKEEDLGFGNVSLSKSKIISAAGKDNENDDHPRTTSSAEAKDKTEQEKRGMLGFLSGLFGGKKTSNEQVSGPVKANLGEPSTFRYDETLKRWVDTKDPASTAPPAPPPPPPSVNASSLSLGPTALEESPASYRRGATRSARSRYVDPFNPDLGGTDETAPKGGVPSIPSMPMLVPSLPIAAGQMDFTSAGATFTTNSNFVPNPSSNTERILNQQRSQPTLFQSQPQSTVQQQPTAEYNNQQQQQQQQYVLHSQYSQNQESRPEYLPQEYNSIAPQYQIQSHENIEALQRSQNYSKSSLSLSPPDHHQQQQQQPYSQQQQPSFNLQPQQQQQQQQVPPPPSSQQQQNWNGQPEYQSDHYRSPPPQQQVYGQAAF